MAVVQISKIQVRRGQKNSNSGVPQLSSAEFAWAVDTQELFIGNGSVAEGAPYVGNTKIITEHDDILNLENGYRFASNDTSITLSVSRSLQSKLDEVQVSVADFDAVGDGSTDCVSAFETAFTELFRNVNDNYKKVLVVPNGEYLFLTDLRIPSNVILRGETELGAILNFGANDIRFLTANGLEFSSFESTNKPQNVKISNLTIRRTTGQTVISGLENSSFDTVTFKGNYVLGNTVADLDAQPAAVFWLNDLAGRKTNSVTFKNCSFESNAISAKCTQTAAFETSIMFETCNFFIGHVGVYISGVPGQINKWQLNDCKFEEVAQQALRSTNGYSTVLQNVTFKNCGNGTATAASPIAPMVYFGEKQGNILINCSSDRQQAAGLVTTTSVAAFTEAYNADRASFVDRNNAVISGSNSFTPVAVFSALNKFFTINYSLILGTHSRNGKLTLSVNDDASNIAITDHYQYSPSLTTDTGGALMTTFEFTADNNGTAGVDTLILYYRNPLILGVGTAGTLSFDVTYGV